MAKQPWRCLDAALPEDERASLQQEIRTSPFLAANPLNYRFADTQGFSVVAQLAGLARLGRDFPRMGQFLDRVRQPWANAFYLNPLVILKGGGVGPHKDLSLRTYCRFVDPPSPRQVTVLYVDIPTDMAGGELTFYGGRRRLGAVVPATNLLVEFEGHLLHDVAPVEVAGETGRMSLVCEQYRLPWIFRRQIPTYRIQSEAAFDGFLREHLDAEDAAMLQSEVDQGTAQ